MASSTGDHLEPQVYTRPCMKFGYQVPGIRLTFDVKSVVRRVDPIPNPTVLTQDRPEPHVYTRPCFWVSKFGYLIQVFYLSGICFRYLDFGYLTRIKFRVFDPGIRFRVSKPHLCTRPCFRVPNFHALALSPPPSRPPSLSLSLSLSLSFSLSLTHTQPHTLTNSLSLPRLFVESLHVKISYTFCTRIGETGGAGGARGGGADEFGESHGVMLLNYSSKELRDLLHTSV